MDHESSATFRKILINLITQIGTLWQANNIDSKHTKIICQSSCAANIDFINKEFQPQAHNYWTDGL